jgi:hypothetical protein
MRIFLLIIIIISFFKSFSQDNTNNVDTINLCYELKIDSSDINCDTIIFNDNNIQEQEFEIIIPHDSLKKNVVIPRNLFELNKKEFLNTYGTNDTSIAIINLFFKKRETATVFLCAEPLPFAGMALGISFMFFSSTAAVLTLGCSAACFIVMPILTIDTLSTWTRKSLYVTLKDYKEKKVIPKFVMKKLKM